MDLVKAEKGSTCWYCNAPAKFCDLDEDAKAFTCKEHAPNRKLPTQKDLEIISRHALKEIRGKATSLGLCWDLDVNDYDLEEELVDIIDNALCLSDLPRN